MKKDKITGADLDATKRDLLEWSQEFNYPLSPELLSALVAVVTTYRNVSKSNLPWFILGWEMRGDSQAAELRSILNEAKVNHSRAISAMRNLTETGNQTFLGIQESVNKLIQTSSSTTVSPFSVVTQMPQNIISDKEAEDRVIKFIYRSGLTFDSWVGKFPDGPTARRKLMDLMAALSSAMWDNYMTTDPGRLATIKYVETAISRMFPEAKKRKI